MDSSKNSQYNSLNLWRILFTFVIMIFHFADSTSFYADYPMINYHWYIAVEFFFVLSGYLLMQHYDNNPDESTLQYIWKRVTRLYPEYLVAFLIMSIIKSIYSGLNIFKIIIPNWLELLMLQSIGTNVFPYVNNPAWYVSALLIVSYFTIYLLHNYKKHFLCFIAPATLLIAFSYMYRKYERLEVFYHTDGMMGNTALIRAAIGLTLGIYAYIISKNYREEFLKIKGGIRVFIELVLFLGTLGFSLMVEEGSYDFLFVVVFAIGIIFSSNDVLLGKIANSRFIKIFSDRSYGLYLAHFAAISIISMFFEIGGKFSMWSVAVYICVTIALSFIYHYIVVLFSFVASALRN